MAKVRTYQQGRGAGLRRALILLLGGGCFVCGETDSRVLEIDHVNDDGYLERRDNVGSSERITGILTRLASSWETERPRYQVLCANCHAKKGKEADGITD